MMWRFYITILTCACSLSFSQVVCETNGAYRKLSTANKVHPDSVYELYLGNNGLKKFPTEILKFRNLEYLYFTNYDCKFYYNYCPGFLTIEESKKFEELREKNANFRHYQFPKFNKNRIKRVPEEIKEFKKLKYLNLSDVKLSRREVKKILKWLPNCQEIITRYPDLDRTEPYRKK